MLTGDHRYKNAVDMKIKLVTFAPHPNFGTCLQSYALNHVLRLMGHDVEFIYNRRETYHASFIQRMRKSLKKIQRKHFPNHPETSPEGSAGQPASAAQNAMPRPDIISLPDHRLLGLISRLPFYLPLAKRRYYDNLQKRKVYKFTFEDGNFKMRRLFSKSDYAAAVNDADMFITGSDQIWNPFCGGYNPMMFLEFVGDGTKCISYSSSISQPEIHPDIRERMAGALKKFSHIAVREQRSVDMLNDMLHRTDVKLVVDPTCLLTAKEWESFGDKADIEFDVPERYIFCYFVGDNRADVYERMVQDVKRFTGIEKVIALECYNRTRIYGDGMTYQDAGPYEWVYLLRHASYICMDSFHAVVFALKFHKEFVHAMKNDDNEAGSQNTRMYDIMRRYGLLYKNYDDDAGTAWQQPVDYGRVDAIMSSEIEDSMNFLRYEIEN